MNTNADLLKELRIDRKAAPSPSRRGLWVGLAIAAIIALIIVAVVFLRSGRQGIEVQTSEVTAIGNGGSGTTVLDATGYVVARRMATVSSKITGRVREILIEEGQRVEAGQIMATLDPVDADAQRALAYSQLEAARSQTGSLQAQLKEAEANASRLG